MSEVTLVEQVNEVEISTDEQQINVVVEEITHIIEIAHIGPQGVPGTTVHSGLTDVTADQHHDEDHAARHASAGDDPVSPTSIGALSQADLDAHAADPIHSGVHPNLAAHDALGLATQLELEVHAAGPHGEHPNLAAHDALGLVTQDELTTAGFVRSFKQPTPPAGATSGDFWLDDSVDPPRLYRKD